jgi:hypothetical protein
MTATDASAATGNGVSVGTVVGVKLAAGTGVDVLVGFVVALGRTMAGGYGAGDPPLIVLFVNKTAVAVTANTSTTKLMTTQATMGVDDDDDDNEAAFASSPALRN